MRWVGIGSVIYKLWREKITIIGLAKYCCTRILLCGRRQHKNIDQYESLSLAEVSLYYLIYAFKQTLITTIYFLH